MSDTQQIQPNDQSHDAHNADANLFVPDNSPAVELIRNKIKNLYADEPSVEQETAQIIANDNHSSKHQQYAASLQASGQTPVQVQAAWHAYYAGLTEHEKHEVWQRFYAENGQTGVKRPSPKTIQDPQNVPPTNTGASINLPAQLPGNPLYTAGIPAQDQPTVNHSDADSKRGTEQQVPTELPSRGTLRHRSIKRGGKANSGMAARRLDSRQVASTAAGIKKRILAKVRSTNSRAVEDRRQLKESSAISSLLFGLGCGAIVIFILMFGFFNELLIAPFIQPSRKATAIPVIVNTATAVVGDQSKLLIPKINLEIPTDYSQVTTDEKAIELALDNGIVHYPTTAKPGETGNAAYFGHSSNNIFNPGKYKFAFVLLHELTDGDTFYLTNNGKVYAYRVFSKRIVPPSEVSVLNPVAGHSATATLITCDPPGTSINRLVVVGDQISPDPNVNSQPTGQVAVSSTTSPESDPALPGNGPSLLSRIINTIF